MTNARQRAANSNSARAESMQDWLMVSSFGFWALVLGLMPVLALKLLTGG